MIDPLQAEARQPCVIETVGELGLRLASIHSRQSPGPRSEPATSARPGEEAQEGSGMFIGIDVTKAGWMCMCATVSLRSRATTKA